MPPIKPENCKLAADDPRHGTNAGYLQGCRRECCREGRRIHQREYRDGQRTGHFTPFHDREIAVRREARKRVLRTWELVE